MFFLLSLQVRCLLLFMELVWEADPRAPVGYLSWEGCSRPPGWTQEKGVSKRSAWKLMLSAVNFKPVSESLWFSDPLPFSCYLFIYLFVGVKGCRGVHSTQPTETTSSELTDLYKHLFCYHILLASGLFLPSEDHAELSYCFWGMKCTFVDVVPCLESLFQNGFKRMHYTVAGHACR